MPTTFLITSLTPKRRASRSPWFPTRFVFSLLFPSLRALADSLHRTARLQRVRSVFLPSFDPHPLSASLQPFSSLRRLSLPSLQLPSFIPGERTLTLSSKQLQVLACPRLRIGRRLRSALHRRRYDHRRRSGGRRTLRHGHHRAPRSLDRTSWVRTLSSPFVPFLSLFFVPFSALSSFLSFPLRPHEPLLICLSPTVASNASSASSRPSPLVATAGSQRGSRSRTTSTRRFPTHRRRSSRRLWLFSPSFFRYSSAFRNAVRGFSNASQCSRRGKGKSTGSGFSGIS
jgi:hypothetical protein